jgi:hypothetical protein
MPRATRDRQERHPDRAVRAASTTSRQTHRPRTAAVRATPRSRADHIARADTLGHRVPKRRIFACGNGSVRLVQPVTADQMPELVNSFGHCWTNGHRCRAPSIGAPCSPPAPTSLTGPAMRLSPVRAFKSIPLRRERINVHAPRIVTSQSETATCGPPGSSVNSVASPDAAAGIRTGLAVRSELASGQRGLESHPCLYVNRRRAGTGANSWARRIFWDRTGIEPAKLMVPRWRYWPQNGTARACDLRSWIAQPTTDLPGEPWRYPWFPPRPRATVGPPVGPRGLPAMSIVNA